MTANQLTFHNVTAFLYDVEQPLPSGTSTAPVLLDVSGYVDFFPRLPSGFEWVVLNLDHGDGTSGDTILPVAPITGRFLNGSLRTIAVGDPVGVQLLSNPTWMNLAAQLSAAIPTWPTTALIYDVRFRNVTYGGASYPLDDFAYTAPVDATPVSLSSPTLTRLPYAGP